MIEFKNKNLERTEPKYFYRVSESVTTFKMDEGKNESFSHHEDFKGNDLPQCKVKAEKYYWERYEGLNHNSYFLPFHSPENFVFGKHAACSLILSFVEFYTDDNFFEHELLGEDEETMAESREIEAEILKTIL
ncbi:MAG: hypothetical protein ACQEWG_11455 [Bacteroidota bacterium]